MVFLHVLDEEAAESPGFIIVPGGHAIAELSACPSVPTQHGVAYHEPNVKSFMDRNKISSIQVCYVHNKWICCPALANYKWLRSI